jgi:ABC-type nitrate/sulfonate/bicarbonate transport system substrate-binding protein
MTVAKVRIGEPYHVVYYAPLHVAQLGGYFAAQGIDVEIVPAASFAALSAGWNSQSSAPRAEPEDSIDIAVGGIMRSLVAYDRGEAVVPVHFARVNDRDGFLLLGRVDGFAWPDLLGKQLIVFAEAPTPLYVLRNLLRNQGLDADRVVVIDDVPITEVAEAFRNGRGDFVLTQAHVAEELLRDGSGFLLRAMAKEAGPLPYSSYYCSSELLRREVETVRSVARGNAAATKWMRSHTGDEIWEMIRPAFAEGDEVLLRAATAHYRALGVWGSDTTLPVESYEGLANALHGGGLITRVAPYRTIIQDEAAREAEAELG